MDRWVEIDLDWFGAPPWDATVPEFVERMAPLWRGSRELYGVCLNVGWLVDLVTEWTGRGEQPLPLRSRRYARWAGLTYDDLRRFVSRLKAEASRAGVGELRVGVLLAGLGQVVTGSKTTAIYDLTSAWYERHPELYPLDVSPLPGPDLDPRVPLAADSYPYATRPAGVRKGESFAELLGAQWGEVSRFLGLDLLHLRDGFFGPMLYQRNGPYGYSASPDPGENASWTDAVVRLVRAAKEANPDALVMAYSSGIGGTAEWLVGCVDLETVVADGCLDVWVDQTWGGAWQDWWDDLWKGWTFQHADLLVHGAMLRGGNAGRERPCRHYKLIETWDGWEPWDTLHRVPEKLRWAMWAFSHAAVLSPDGPIVPEGAYVSWANDWAGRLLAPADVEFVRRNLELAESSAAELEEVYGPLVVHERATLVAQAAGEPAANVSPWIEDYTALAMKFGAPVLAATRTEWLPERSPEGVLVQVPGALDASTLARLDSLGGPVLAVGRADRLHPELLARAGVRTSGELRQAGYRIGRDPGADPATEDAVHMPEHAEVALVDGASARYETGGLPLLAGRGRHLVWQPPDLAEPANPLLPRSQLGSVAPYARAAAALAELALEAGGIGVVPPEEHSPVTVQCWRSGGVVHVLCGNLETGWIGDARHPRSVTVVLPRARLGLPDGVAFALEPVGDEDGDRVAPAVGGEAGELRFVVDVPPEGCRILRLEPAGGAG